MDVKKYKQQIKEKVIIPLKEEIKELRFSCHYSYLDVWDCMLYLTWYIKKLNKIKNPSDDKILKVVKWVVLGLNKLHKRTKCNMIQTDIREEICEIIQSSAIECGLKNYDEDITEEWREW